MKLNKLLLSTIPMLGLCAVSAHAGIIFNGASGSTVYGATPYTGLNLGGPSYIADNVTGNNDILSSPGGGFQVASPVVGNNVAETPGIGFNTLTPYVFSWTGGTAPLSGAAFGSGTTIDDGNSLAFTLSDSTAGCCTASYMITSTDADYTVDANGYAGTIGAYLSLGGINLTSTDSSVASLIVDFSIDGGAFVQLPQMVLAVTGNCVNDVTIAGTLAAETNSACTGGGNGGSFAALALDNLGAVNWGAGTTIEVISTLTAYSDPSTIDSISPDLSLLGNNSLPGFALDGVAAPEPGAFLLFGAGLTALGLIRRRKSA